MDNKQNMWKIKTPYGTKNWAYIKRLMDEDVKGVSIDKIPTLEDLQRLKEDVEEAIHYYDGGNQLTYDHLENAIARVLDMPVPNAELEAV